MSNTTHIAIVRDHSGSMRSLASSALKDFNLTIDGIRQSTKESGDRSFVSVVECGVGAMGATRLVHDTVPVDYLPNLTDYVANGSSTPLWDSVGMAITTLENALGKNDPTVAYLVMVITDGLENASKIWNASKVADAIQRLQATDRWTFAFRVPVGQKRVLVNLGIPSGNIIEWEQTTEALEKSTKIQTSSVGEYFNARTRGLTSVNTFYADAVNLSEKQVSNALDDISGRIKRHVVSPHQDGIQIKDFCIEKFGKYQIGSAYYQLTKTEKVQPSKDLIILDKNTNKAYGGPSARALLGLPQSGEIRLAPGQFGHYEVYVKSTSVNRKLYDGNAVIYKN